MRNMRWLIGMLRRHLLLIFGLLAVFAIMVMLWSVPAWPLAVVAVLERHLLLIGILGGGLIVFILLWRLPKWQTSRIPDVKDRLTVENAARQTLAQIIGGAVLITGLFFTWANLKITQETATKSQETATKNLEMGREGQITDRFTKAIAQLGEQGRDKLAVRLGGIYALERIARDSERDHWPIMEVLTAYVREHAPWPPKPPKDVQSSAGNQSPQEEPPATLKQSLPQPPTDIQAALTTLRQSLPQPPADIQAALTVIGRRAHIYHNGEEQRLNLANTDLRGATLRDAQLQGADLQGAQLQGADLQGAQLQGATLRDAQLQGANLFFAGLQGATLQGAQLQGTNLRSAQLQGATLRDAQLQEADLFFARLDGVISLTVEQLSLVNTLSLATLDPQLLEQMQQRYPQLLDPPQLLEQMQQRYPQLFELRQLLEQMQQRYPQFLEQMQQRYPQLLDPQLLEQIQQRYPQLLKQMQRYPQLLEAPQ